VKEYSKITFEIIIKTIKRITLALDPLCKITNYRQFAYAYGFADASFKFNFAVFPVEILKLILWVFLGNFYLLITERISFP